MIRRLLLVALQLMQPYRLQQKLLPNRQLSFQAQFLLCIQVSAHFISRHQCRHRTLAVFQRLPEPILLLNYRQYCRHLYQHPFSQQKFLRAFHLRFRRPFLLSYQLEFPASPHRHNTHQSVQHLIHQLVSHLGLLGSLLHADQLCYPQNQP